MLLSLAEGMDFVDEIGKDNLDQEKITKVVLELIRLNKDNIWTDALEEYNLIENKNWC